MALRHASWTLAGVLSAAIAASLALAGDGHAADPTGAAQSQHPADSRHNVLFTTALPDVPGNHLVVVALKFDPGHHGTPHRHPGSVFVYVTKGTAKLGIDGQPTQLVHEGETFFEPPGALHTVAESASSTEPVSAIAVMIVPDGAPLLTVDTPKR